MFTSEQIQYLEDVLGTPSAAYLQASSMVEAVPVVSDLIVVVTPVLSAAEQALLEKILASIQLNDFLQCQQVDSNLVPKHVLSFQGAANPGRNGNRWDFPALASMLGDGPEVAAQKKATWTLLKQFAQEI